MLFVTIAAMLAADDVHALPSKITPGPQTTVFAEPLLPGGFVDYISAVNQLRSKNVKRDENGTRLLLTLWDGAGATKYQKDRLARELDITFGDGSIFIPLDAWLKRERVKSFPPEETLQSLFIPRAVGFDVKPFVPSEQPQLRAWLNENRPALEVAAKAVRMPKWYAPLAPTRKHPQLILEMRLPATELVRDLAKAFAVRGSFYTAIGKMDKAFDDIDTLHLLASKIDAHSDPLDLLIATAIVNAAGCLEVQAVKTGKADAATCRKRLAALRKLPEPISVDVVLDRMNRWATLNAAAYVLAGGDEVFKLPAFGPPSWIPQSSRDPAKEMLREAGRALVDQDEALRFINRRYDELVAALRNPDREIGQRVQSDIHSRMVQDYSKGELDLGEANDVAGDASKILGRRCGAAAFARLLPEYHMLVSARSGAIMHRRLATGAWALSVYHAEHGRWPDKLDELADVWPLAEHKDDYGAFRYKPRGDSVVLYSLNWNEEDDDGVFEVGGRDRIKGDRRIGPPDDIAVTLTGGPPNSKS